MKVLLTGGSKGIGLAVLQQLVQSGHEIVVVNRKTSNAQKNLPIEVWNYDLSDPEQVDEVCAKIRHMCFDVLINNAGAGIPCTLENMQANQVRKEVELNLIAPLLLVQAVLPGMEKNQFGRIVNISSTTGKIGVPYLFAYSATKAGVISITQSIARYIKNKNITINTICPGGIDTEMSVNGRKKISRFLDLDEETYQERMVESMGIGRLIQCSEVAEVLMSLIRPECGFITGQSINICGSMEVI